MAVYSAWALFSGLPMTDRMIGHRLEEAYPRKSFRGHASRAIRLTRKKARKPLISALSDPEGWAAHTGFRCPKSAAGFHQESFVSITVQ